MWQGWSSGSHGEPRDLGLGGQDETVTEPDDGIRLPRSILILSDAKYKELTRDPSSVELLEDFEALVIPFSGKAEGHQEDVEAIRALLSDRDLLVSGALLIRNPYEVASFEFAEDAIEAFASAKYHELANVARLLGARTIDFVEVKVEQNRSATRGSLTAKAPAGSGKAEASQDVARKIEERLEGHLEFGGGDPDGEGAREYMKRRRLLNDQQIAALVEMRSGANPVQRYRMTLNGTRESTTNLKSALKLANAGPVKAAEIGAAFSKTAESISRIEITTDIEF